MSAGTAMQSGPAAPSLLPSECSPGPRGAPQRCHLLSGGATLGRCCTGRASFIPHGANRMGAAFSRAQAATGEDSTAGTSLSGHRWHGGAASLPGQEVGDSKRPAGLSLRCQLPLELLFSFVSVQAWKQPKSLWLQLEVQIQPGKEQLAETSRSQGTTRCPCKRQSFTACARAAASSHSCRQSFLPSSLSQGWPFRVLSDPSSS